MWNFDVTVIVLLVSGLALSACEPMTAPPTSAAAEADLTHSAPKNGGIEAKTTGGGQYDFDLAGEIFAGKFSFAATQFSQGSAAGRLRYVLDLGDGIPDVIEGGLIEFHGDVTCVTVDREQGRAWVGGIITRNRSTQPFYRDDATTQVGKDVWFRVLDGGEGAGAVDRTTFVGFEGNGGIITSQEYCDTRIWPDDNARTHPVSGNIQVHD